MNYDSALDRAYDTLPERTREACDRLQVPDPEGESDGAFTRLTNLGDILVYIHSRLGVPHYDGRYEER